MYADGIEISLVVSHGVTIINEPKTKSVQFRFDPTTDKPNPLMGFGFGRIFGEHNHGRLILSFNLRRWPLAIRLSIVVFATVLRRPLATVRTAAAAARALSKPSPVGHEVRADRTAVITGILFVPTTGASTGLGEVTNCRIAQLVTLSPH